MTVFDSTPPTPPVAAGPLTDATWHSGTVGFNVSSNDNVGISQVQVDRSDGSVLATVGQTCDYTNPVPCHAATGVPVQIDTTTLDDGVNALRLVATDAAQNSTTSTVNVLIANHAPPQPMLSGTPAGWTTQGAASVVAQVPSHGVPIARLDWMLCTASCGPTNSVAVPAGTPSVTFDAVVPADGAYAIEATTVDAAGHTSATSEGPFDVSRTPPAPPTRLSAGGAPGGPIAVDWVDPPHAAPITTAFWQLCPRGGACGPVATGPDRHPLIVGASPGTYNLRVWLGDAAGNADSGRPATVTVTVPRTGTTPTLPTRSRATVSLPVAVGRDGVRLYMTLRRRAGRQLALDVQANPRLPGRVRIGLAFRGHSRKTHRLGLHHGAATVIARIPPAAGDLTITLNGLGVTATRRVHLGR